MIHYNQDKEKGNSPKELNNDKERNDRRHVDRIKTF